MGFRARIISSSIILWVPVLLSGRPLIHNDNGRIRIETERYKTVFQHGCLVEIENKLADEVYTVPADTQTVGKGLAASACTARQANTNQIEITYQGLSGRAGFLPDSSVTFTLKVEEKSGDLVINAQGKSTGPAEGIGWSVMNLGDSYKYHLPVREGFFADRDFPITKSPQRFSSYDQWEVPILVGAGKGAFAVWAQDKAGWHKFLTLEHQPGFFNFAFETENQQPWKAGQTEESVTWHFNVFKNWTEAARRFQEWMESAYGLKRIENRTPNWMQKVYAVCQANRSPDTAADILAGFVNPESVLIYHNACLDFPKDSDGYDLHAPLLPGSKEKITYAQNKGFHVALYSFGPMVCRYNKKEFEQFKNVASHGFSQERAYYCGNPAAKEFRDYLTGYLENYQKASGADGFYLDVGFIPANNPLIDGLTSAAGARLWIEEFRKRNPEICLWNEYAYEAIIANFPLAYTTALPRWAGNENIPFYVKKASPIEGAIFCPYVMKYAGSDPADNQTQDFRERTGRVMLTPFYIADLDLYAGAKSGAYRYAAKQMKTFSDNRLRPYLPEEWADHVRFYWRSPDGTIFKHVDLGSDGAALVREVSRDKDSILLARITNSRCLPEGLFLPGWPGRDGERFVGLDPQCTYFAFSDEGREMPEVAVIPPEDVSIGSYRSGKGFLFCALITEVKPHQVTLTVNSQKELYAAFQGEERLECKKVRSEKPYQYMLKATVPGPIVIFTEEPLTTEIPGALFQKSSVPQRYFIMKDRTCIKENALDFKERVQIPWQLDWPDFKCTTPGMMVTPSRKWVMDMPVRLPASTSGFKLGIKVSLQETGSTLRLLFNGLPVIKQSFNAPIKGWEGFTGEINNFPGGPALITLEMDQVNYQIRISAPVIARAK